MPEYEHFSFYQNVLFMRIPESSGNPDENARKTLEDIIVKMGDP